MWTFTARGFFSVVKGDPDPETGEKKVWVRARILKDIAGLHALAGQMAKEDHWVALQTSRIITTPERDYPFRFEISKFGWGLLLAKMADEIDYENFKDRVGHEDMDRAVAYTNVWAVMLHFGDKRFPRKAMRGSK